VLGVVNVHLELILLEEKVGLLEGQRRASRLALNHEREFVSLRGNPATSTPPRPWPCLTTSDKLRKDCGSSIMNSHVHTNSNSNSN